MRDDPRKSIDVLIATAIQLEYDAFKRAALCTDATDTGVGKWEKLGVGTTTPYLHGEYRVRDKAPISMALVRSTRMGSTSTSPLVSSLVEQLKPSCLAMCGVCAGNPSDVALGDAVIAEMVFAYDEGKRSATGIERDFRQVPMEETWLRGAQDFEVDGLPSFGAATEDDARLWLLERLYGGGDPVKHPARQRYFPPGTWNERLQRMIKDGLLTRSGVAFALTSEGRSFVEGSLAFNVDPPQRLPFAVKVGPMASGNVVVKDGVTWQMLKETGNRTALGVEMEAATIGTIAQKLKVPYWIVAKGVMDHADPLKDDRYKEFAARASAEVLLRFFEAHLSQDSITPRPVEGKSTYASISEFSNDGLIFLPDIERSLTQVNSQFADLFAVAKSAALDGFKSEAKAVSAADAVRRGIGPKIQATLKSRGKSKRVVIKSTASARSGETYTGAVLFNSGDEYCGELANEAEHGFGVYKIYEITRDHSPDSVSFYKGAFDGGKFGPLGVYYFPAHSRFSGSWIDSHPRLGYRTFLEREDGYKFYFGNFNEVDVGRLTLFKWTPNGRGIMIAADGKLVFGDFRDGKLVREAPGSPISLGLRK